MAHVRFNYRSEALSKYIDVTVTFPADNYSFYTDDSARKPRISHGKNTKPQYRPGMKFQTVYLIHGGGDDDTTPYRFTNVERYADENNVMLVTPDISNSFGADTEYGVDYELFLTSELPCLIQAIFPSSPKREDNFIIGFAMGGNVALSAALRYPELYSVCVDMSGGIGYTLNTAGFKAEMESDHFKNHFFRQKSLKAAGTTSIQSPKLSSSPEGPCPSSTSFTAAKKASSATASPKTPSS